MTRRYLSRRTFLRGALAGGATAAVGLPVLDAMLNLEGTAFADGTKPPTRFVQWFWGNGTQPGAWAPTATGAAWRPTSLLGGLADVRDHVSIISGTSLPVRRANNPHVEGAVGMLTGGNPIIDPAYPGSANDWDFMTVSGPSIDEVAAGVLGEAAYRSLVVAVTPLHGVNGPGTAVRYTSHRAPYLYNDPLFDPGAVYDLLFADGKATSPEGPTPEDLARASVLEAVREEAGSLRVRLGASDRVRLEAHLDALRDLERRVRATATPPPAGCTMPAPPATTASSAARAALMGELIAMAFTCDLTRVASMEFSSPASHSGFPDIFPAGLTFNGSPISFHEYEHNAGYTGNTLNGLQYFVNVFGAFVKTLRDTPETDGSLLDHTLVLGTSELADGANHNFDDFPLFLAGGANGALRQGIHLRAEGANAARVPLTALRALGWTEPAWGREQFRVTDPFAALLG